MIPDKAIEEIRAVRQQISEQYGYDITAFLDHYRELEKQYKDRLVATRDTEPLLPSGRAATKRT